MWAVLLCAVFFLSGVAALMFENLWFYQAGIALGNPVLASSVVLAGFMGGLAVGNALAGRFGHRLARPVRAYAWLELAIGATGLALVLLLPGLTPALASLLGPLLDRPWLAHAVRGAIALVLLLGPATAMGATLPVMVAALARHDPRFGRALGRLYGWNTLGAVCGALVGELWLLEALGVRGTAFAALAVNLLAATAALALSRRVERGPAAGARPSPAPLPGRARGLLVAAALSGFALLALEVVWFRFLLLFVYGTGAAFALMLAVVLAGIGLGGLVGSVLAARSAAALRHLPVLASATGLVVIGLYAGFPGAFRAVHWLEIARLAAVLMLPVALASGVLFTLLGEALAQAAPGEARAAGFLTLANTTGAMLGSLAAGFVLLPGIGIEASFVLLALLYGVVGLVLGGALSAPGAPAAGASRRPQLVATGLLVVASLLLPWGAMARRHLEAPLRYYRETDRARPIALREGLGETLVYLQTDAFGEPLHHRLLTNGFSMSATNLYAQRYMRLFVHLPEAFHPELRSALLICYGVGMTASALAETGSLERVDVVDVSPDVLELGRLAFPPPESFPLDDPRFHVHVGDGRYFLQTTRQRFDLITGEPPPPKLAGVVSLYTREYFELVHARLAPGGLASYWLPVHSLDPTDAFAITRAFCDVFRDCSLWNGAGLDWILLGSRGGMAEPEAARFARPWHDARTGAMLRALGFEEPAQLAAAFLAGPGQLAEWTAGTPPLVDAWPRRLSHSLDALAAATPFYLRFMDAAAARARFEASPFVAEILPPDVRSAALAAFADQAVIDRLLLSEDRPFPEALPAVDRLLDRGGRETLVLWHLRSDALRQRAAERALARGGLRPAARGEQALGLLARGAWREAAEGFRVAREAGVPGEAWLQLEAYARLRGAAPAAELAPLLGALHARGTAGDRSFLAFVQQRFDPAPAAAAPHAGTGDRLASRPAAPVAQRIRAAAF